MPNTPYKGYSVPTTGTESGTWGSDLNTNTFAVIDNNLGGIVTKTLSSSDITLTAAESQCLILRLIGTTTNQIQITTSCQGLTVIENATLGGYPVTITNGVGVSTICPNMLTSIVVFDNTNGSRAASEDIPSGTFMLFIQSAAPLGWTKQTLYNDRALRVVSGTASFGGNTAFSTIFTNRTLSVNQLPPHVHGVSDPGHIHPLPFSAKGSTSGMNSITFATSLGYNIQTDAATTGISVESTGSGANIDFAVAYVDAIVAVKN
jgi:hypothetical protein